MNIKIDPSRIFTRQQVDVMLTAAINKTLLQVDKVKLFAHHEGRDKVKSIAGSIKKYSTMERKEIEVFSEKVDIFYLLGVLNSKRANELLDDIRGVGNIDVNPEYIRNIHIPLVPKNTGANSKLSQANTCCQVHK